MAVETKKDPAKVVTGTHRISYVHVKEATAFNGEGDPKYDVTLLIPKDHPDVKKVKEAINNVYKANKESVFNGTPLTSPKMWNPLRNGEEWLEEHPEAKEYEGCYFLKASSKSRPAVFDADKQEILDLDEVYSGCYCRASIKAYAFNNKSKGIGFFLNSLMKTKDGERLGGVDVDPDDFDEEDGTTFEDNDLL